MPGVLRAGDEYWMRRALDLASRGLGRTRPNPAVGAVVVDSAGRLVAEDYHHRAGELHAEALALRMAGERARGATLYVTLEPCSHYGRTPPCAELIVRMGVSRVVAALADPNPLVSGRGYALLRSAGVEVIEGVLAREAAELDRGFLWRHLFERPHVTLKAAASLDGKLATRTGDSRWITGPAARQRAHQLRDICDVVLVGRGTVVADNPRLTCRIEGGRDPVRCILDSKARTPLEATVLNEPGETWMFVTDRAPTKQLERLREKGASIKVVRADEKSRCRLDDVMAVLQQEGILRVMVEGGSRVHGALVEAGLVDEVALFVSPRIIGGESAPTTVGGDGVATVDDAMELGSLSVEELQDDLLISGYVKGRSPLDVYRNR